MRKKHWAGVVGLTLGAVSCGEPEGAPPVRPQSLFSSKASATDSLKGEGWKNHLSAGTLHAAWVPPERSPWRPYYKPTLVAAMSIVRDAAVPVHGPASSPAAEEFAAKEIFRGAAVFVDLPGEQSVAWAAALQARALQPVVTFNNWPHQSGFLKLERALGALLYYAPQAAAGRAAVPEGAPPAFILEGNRLSHKGMNPDASVFDNRYFHASTDFPPAALLRAHQIDRIYYVHARAQPSVEEDDLNAYFTDLASKGLGFAYFPVSGGTYRRVEATPVARPTIFTAAETARYAGSRPYGRHYGHYHNHYFWSRSRGSWGSGSSGGGGSGFSS